MDYTTSNMTIDRIRNSVVKNYTFKPKNTAFCECCKSVKPCFIKANKGWKCSDCTLNRGEIK